MPNESGGGPGGRTHPRTGSRGRGMRAAQRCSWVSPERGRHHRRGVPGHRVQYLRRQTGRRSMPASPTCAPPSSTGWPRPSRRRRRCEARSARRPPSSTNTPPLPRPWCRRYAPRASSRRCWSTTAIRSAAPGPRSGRRWSPRPSYAARSTPAWTRCMRATGSCAVLLSLEILPFSVAGFSSADDARSRIGDLMLDGLTPRH